MAKSVGVSGSLRRLKRVPPDIVRGGAFVRAVRVILRANYKTGEYDVEYAIETFGGTNAPPETWDAVVEPVYALPVALDYRVGEGGGNVEGDGGASELPELDEEQLDQLLREVEQHIENNVFAAQRTRNTAEISEDRDDSAAAGTARNPRSIGAKDV